MNLKASYHVGLSFGTLAKLFATVSNNQVTLMTCNGAPMHPSTPPAHIRDELRDITTGHLPISRALYWSQA